MTARPTIQVNYDSHPVASLATLASPFRHDATLCAEGNLEDVAILATRRLYRHRPSFLQISAENVHFPGPNGARSPVPKVEDPAVSPAEVGSEAFDFGLDGVARRANPGRQFPKRMRRLDAGIGTQLLKGFSPPVHAARLGTNVHFCSSFGRANGSWGPNATPSKPQQNADNDADREHCDDRRPSSVIHVLSSISDSADRACQRGDGRASTRSHWQGGRSRCRTVRRSFPKCRR